MTSSAAGLPWHEAQWRALSGALDAGRLHHAILLEGPPGLGKDRFAERAAAAVLCESPEPAAQRPCGSCRSCALTAAGSHPDRLDLQPQEDRKVIDVDQVRERLAELALTPHYASRRVIVVAPADALNRHAANTLLKTLEEPPGGALFLLVTARPSSLPATVRSRCAAMRFAAPAADVAAAWLRAERADLDSPGRLLAWSAGAPLAALAAADASTLERFDDMVDDVAALLEGRAGAVGAAAKWRKIGLAETVDWQLRLVAALMRAALGGARDENAVAMQALARRLDSDGLDRVGEVLYELRDALERQLNPGEQLALESIAASWRGAARVRA